MIQIFFITSTHHTDHTPICQHNTPLDVILHSKNLELVFNILGMKTEIHANFIDKNNILAISIWVSKGFFLECLMFLKSLLSSLPTYLSLFTILTFVTSEIAKKKLWVWCEWWVQIFSCVSEYSLCSNWKSECGAMYIGYFQSSHVG